MERGPRGPWEPCGGRGAGYWGKMTSLIGTTFMPPG